MTTRMNGDIYVIIVHLWFQLCSFVERAKKTNAKAPGRLNSAIVDEI